MTNNPISKLLRLVMLLAVVLLLSSCRQDDDSYSSHPGPTTLVSLSVSASNSGAVAASDDPASSIRDLCILQFNVNGTGFGNLRHVAKGSPASAGTFNATLLQSVNPDDKYKLVLLANLPDYGFLNSLSGKSYDQVQKTLLSEEFSGVNNILSFDGSRPFPMFGVANSGNSIEITANMSLSDVSLIRGVARVDIGIGIKNADDTWNKNGVKFNMTQIQIWKAGKQYAYMPSENNFSSTGRVDGVTITGPSPVGTTETKVYDITHITNNTYCSGKIYLPEADLNWGDVYDANHTDRLAVIVGGKYNGSQTETFYRVDFKNDVSGEKMDILRNHVYRFTVTKVTDDGYDTAELAYKSIPKDISFTAELTPWTFPPAVSVPSIIGYRMVYQNTNGGMLLWNTATGLTIPKKRDTWKGTKMNFNYNGFYDETNNVYAITYPIEPRNGSLYHTIEVAFDYEGVYPSLMVSADDVTDVTGGDTNPWKTGKTLTAFDICRNYEGDGFGDWRLPRLSELALLYLNRGSLEAKRGFAPLSGTYWSGSEYLVSDSKVDKRHSEQAWGINFDATNPGNAAPYDKTTKKFKIRCVRQTQ